MPITEAERTVTLRDTVAGRSRLLGAVSSPSAPRIDGFAGDSRVDQPAESRVSLSAVA
jgi:hypothetical protein